VVAVPPSVRAGERLEAALAQRAAVLHDSLAIHPHTSMAAATGEASHGSRARRRFAGGPEMLGDAGTGTGTGTGYWHAAVQMCRCADMHVDTQIATGEAAPPGAPT
jgi:hypothetical protein